ncbi:Tetratricopeptide repeat protein 37 [Labeo rohita]|uniref:Tetratricopeptide repeat protein 37 n=1 Tax=Labeo rohita TaxID=84645 RepID=A0ABQ8M8R2_LABRO|nr:Tetratricopeptide repeat protein 37 [Labeo rohita]
MTMTMPDDQSLSGCCSRSLQKIGALIRAHVLSRLRPGGICAGVCGQLPSCTVDEAESSLGSLHVSITNPESSPIMALAQSPVNCCPTAQSCLSPSQPEPAAVIEQAPSGATELTIAPELEPQMSDQVREPTARAKADTAVEIVKATESPTHCTTAEGEQELDLGDLIDFHSEIPILLYSSELLTWGNIPPNLPLPPPLINLFPSSTPSPLDPVSSSAHPQLTICGVGSPQVCPSPAPLASSLEDPSTLPPASEGQTPPRSCDPAAPVCLPAPLSLRLRLGLHSSGCASSLRSIGLLLPSSSSSVLCCSGSAAACRIDAYPSVIEAMLRLGPLDPRLHPGLLLSVSTSGSTSTCSVGWPPGVVSPSSTMAPPSIGSTVGRHHDCGPCLTPPAPGPPGILLGSSLHQSHPGRLEAFLSRPPPEPPPSLHRWFFCGTRSRLPGGGRTVIVMNSFLVFCFTWVLSYILV